MVPVTELGAAAAGVATVGAALVTVTAALPTTDPLVAVIVAAPAISLPRCTRPEAFDRTDPAGDRPGEARLHGEPRAELVVTDRGETTGQRVPLRFRLADDGEIAVIVGEWL